jgi:AcrR family transcriptional regulator
MFALSGRPMHTDEMTTRRARLRAATIREIKDAALAQIADAGAPALSLRGVARSIGMSPAGLYRYYDGRDAILTDLITDAYAALATAVEHGIASGGESPTDRFAAGIRAYRQWSIDHRNEFLLIFGTPIPGYAAPEDGPTVDANRRMGRAFFAVGIEAWQRGTFRPISVDRPPTPGEEQLASEIDAELPPSLVPIMLGTWAHFHGLVTLEVLGQLHWVYPTAPETFFETELRRLLDGLALE